MSVRPARMKNFVLALALVAACKSNDNKPAAAKAVEATAPAAAAPAAAAPAAAAPAAAAPAAAAPAAAAPAAATADMFGAFDRNALTYDLAAMFPGAKMTVEKQNDQVEGGGRHDSSLFHGDTVVVEKDGAQVAWVELVDKTNIVRSITLWGAQGAEPQIWEPAADKQPAITARPAK
jgi:hypothetical protein